MDFCFILLVIAVIVFFLTMVGHGLWLLFAGLFRLLFGETSPPLPRRDLLLFCVRCGRRLPPGDRWCAECGLDQDCPKAQELADLTATERQLRRFREEGILTEAAHQMLLTKIEVRREALLPSRPVRAVEEIPTVLPVEERPPAVIPVPQAVPSPLAPRPSPLAPPAPPRRTFGELLSAFMEESNILWGELVGGILIVGCSIALVISLWSKLEENPLYQFGIFAALTSMLFGVGLYTLHHWKLESTSRGLLIIASLLVPLNFLTLAAQPPETRGVGTILIEAASLGGFAWLLHVTAKAIVPLGRIWLPVAVAGTSACQLLASRMMGSEEGIDWLPLAGWLAVGCHGFGSGAVLRRAFRPPPDLQSSQAHPLFSFLGISTFAVCVTLGFCIHLGGELASLAAVIAVSGAPLLFGGVLMHRYLVEELALLRTAATGTALTGMFVMLLAVGLAWPQPGPLILVCALDFLILTRLAFRQELPLVHTVALFCLALGYVTIYHLLQGHELREEILSAESGSTWVYLSLILGIVAGRLHRGQRLAHAVYYAVGGGVLASIALLLVTFPTRGLDEPERAMLAYGICGAGCLALNVRWRQPMVSSIGLALLVAATLWALWWQRPHELPLWAAVLAVEALVMGVAGGGWQVAGGLEPLASGGRQPPVEERGAWLREPLARSAEMTALLAFLTACWAAGSLRVWEVEYLVAGGCLSALFVILALAERSPVHTFLGGLLANWTVLVWHTLTFIEGRLPLEETLRVQWCVQWFQLFAITAGLWAMLWLVVRNRLYPGSESPVLLQVKVVLGIVGNAILLAVALGLLLIFIPPSVAGWTQEAGSLLGWLALLTVAGSTTQYLFQRLPSPAHPPSSILHPPSSILHLPFSILGLAALGLFACTISRFTPAWGFRSWMLGWSAFPLLGLLLVSASPRLRVSVSPPSWVTGFGMLSGALLGLHAAYWHDDSLWAAVAIALPCPAGVALALRQRREGWAFFSGLCANLAASLVVWHFHHEGTSINRFLWVRLLQANTLAFAIVALAWLGLRQRFFSDRERIYRAGPLLGVQVVLGLAGNFLLLLPPVLVLFLEPGWRLPETVLPVLRLGDNLKNLVAMAAATAVTAVQVLRLGDNWGSLAFLLALLAAGWYGYGVAAAGRWEVRFRVFLALLGTAGLGIGVLLACLALNSAGGNWAAYHLLTAVWTLTGVLCLSAVGLQRETAIGFGSRWVTLLSLLVTVLAIRGAWDDPSKPYWSAGTVLVVSMMMATLALWTARPFYIYASGLLINVLGKILWIAWGSETLENFIYVQAICFAVASACWFVLGTWATWRKPAPSPQPLSPKGRGALSDIPGSPQTVRFFTQLTALLALYLLGSLVSASVYLTVLEIRPMMEGTGVLAWWTLAVTVTAFALRLSEREAKDVLPGLYLLGLMGLGLALDAAGMNRHDFCWTAALALAGYALLTSLVYRFQAHGWLSTGSKKPPEWFLFAQDATAVVLIFLSLWMSLDARHSLMERLAGPLTTLAMVSALVIVIEGWRTASRAAPELYRLSQGRTDVLGLGALAAVEIGWALLDPAGREFYWLGLHRTVVLMVSLAFVTFLYGQILPALLSGLVLFAYASGSDVPRPSPLAPRPSLWAVSCRNHAPIFGFLAGLTLLLVIAEEASFYARRGEVGMETAAIVVLVVALVGLTWAGLSYAVRPGRDPLGLSVEGRMLYVYAAEAFLVLLFVHLRLTVPELFRLHFFARYWPFIVMALAFGGAGMSEYFGRKGQRVLAEPLERTGLFLPVLPMLAFWVLPPSNYAWLWFLAGLLYASLSFRKQSFVLALLAALAANMGLWVLLYDGGISILKHPQVWLIPPAVITLASEHWNRDRLGKQQSALLRHTALLILYVSSSADMFIAGIGNSVILPLVLTLLSVVGILMGMLLRVRAFLSLGFAFLLLVILTMIWYAGVDRGHTWILWSFGIALGVAILALFGVFEKRRNDVLRLVEELRRWE